MRYGCHRLLAVGRRRPRGHIANRQWHPWPSFIRSTGATAYWRWDDVVRADTLPIGNGTRGQASSVARVPPPIGGGSTTQNQRISKTNIAPRYVRAMHHNNRKALNRRGGAGDARFLTFSCYEKRHLLESTAARDLFATHLANWSVIANIAIHAWIAMPNHIHLLLTPCDDQLAIALARLKRGFSVEYAKQNLGRGRVWMPGGGYDRHIWSAQCFARAVDYIHTNPCRSGMVDEPREWRWSSATDWEVGPRADMPRVQPPVGELIDLREWSW